MSEANAESKVVEIKLTVKQRLNFKFVDPIAAAENEKREIPMLIEGLKLGTAGILAGDGGVGKSTLLIAIAYGLAHPELDVFNVSRSKEPKRVLIMSAEDDEDIVNNKMHDFDKLNKFDDRQRMLAARGVFITTEKNLMEKITDSGWIERLKVEIEELSVDLVVFDTYSVFGGVENENDNAEAAKIITILNKKLIAGSNLCVLLVHHTNGDGDIRGAKALRMNTRATYVIRRPTEDEARSLDAFGFISSNYANFEIIKSNYARRGSLCWLEMTDVGVFKLAGDDAVEAVNTKVEKDRKGGALTKAITKTKKAGVPREEL